MALCECEYCQNIFNGAGEQKICPNCTKMLDGVFAQARKFMYSTHEKVTVERLVEELDVPEKAIEYLIKQKRLVIEPKGGGRGKCRICGAPTDGQALCEKCRSVVSSSMQKLEVEKEEKRRREQEQGMFDRGAKPMATYWTAQYGLSKEGRQR